MTYYLRGNVKHNKQDTILLSTLQELMFRISRFLFANNMHYITITCVHRYILTFQLPQMHLYYPEGSVVDSKGFRAYFFNLFSYVKDPHSKMTLRCIVFCIFRVGHTGYWCLLAATVYPCILNGISQVTFMSNVVQRWFG